MSHFDKIVKLACKPKAAPPKAKYIDPILAGTYSEDGTVGDICRALQPRFREPNAIVVFKALIVLHTMIRNGCTDNVLSYLSSSEVLHLRNVAGGNWEGYSAPQNLQHYAIYLDSRIRAYRDLKHDIIKVQSENNRDMRLSKNIEEELGSKSSKSKASTNGSGSGSLARGKTVAGRKLRVMTVEKGLLRETKAVQRMIDTLLECKFYLDDLEDELTITALRMLVKDLLILFSACNEGVINVLEHYFEMSRVDAEDALKVYLHFCKQCERVVDYLAIATKLQNLLNVQIPNMRHAPVSLAGSLQEYLDDPNFEQNRIEYKLAKENADKNAKLGKGAKNGTSSPNKPSTPKPGPSSESSNANGSKPASQSQAVQDFFESIEQAQPTMFNPQTGSPTANYFQQQAAFNPFAQMQAAQATGFGMPSFGGGMQPQATGMPFGAGGLQPQATGMLAFGQMGVQPQATGFPGVQQQHQHNPFSQAQGQQQPQLQVPQQQSSPFQQPQQQQQLQTPQQASSPFGQLQPQPTGAFNLGAGLGGASGGLLQSQATGANPFRASMLMPQTTGFPAFGASSSNGVNLFGSTPAQNQTPQNQGQGQGQGQGGLGASLFGSGTSFGSIAQPSASSSSSIASGPFARPASAPLRASPPPAQPVKTHQTGSRNPFGPVITPEKAPPVPKAPTIMEIAMGYANGNKNGNNGAGNAGGLQPQATGFPGSGLQSQQTGFPGSGLQSQQTGFPGSGLQSQQTGFPGSSTDSSLFGGAGTGTAQNGSAMSSIASSFTFNSNNSNKPGTSSNGPASPLSSQNTATTTTGSLADSLFSLSLSSQPTGATTTASTTGSTAPFSPTISVSPPGAAGGLKPQTTGLMGLKQFKPSSSFGASLLESLPPIPQSGPNTPAATGGPATSPLDTAGANGAGSPSVSNTSNFSSLGAQPTGIGGIGSQPTGFGAFNASSTSTLGTSSGLTPFGGSSLGVGLRPQMTGAANPFRASMAGSPAPGAGPGGSGGNAFGGAFTGTTPTSSFGSSMFGQGTGANAFGTNATGNAFGSSLFGNSTTAGQQQQQQQQQQPQQQSLF
ncbi:ANTH-domain-containing protein [Punctularia strigosozonata HHB-11173 SS5]|uniref:ANTH-domain-containing protein n=1 Tax=Punctularia strigosozonata (strain HHB-11173) TaxID=741275 RepID=UPI000441689C|nr:ANTH-domain-containing protein [Punctularia strigosozonata HHB-11173 SS5]EIN09626.1 ANTH-domain-containing protein [Punctularia strigosozonata HHB-11173 SS5]